MAGSVLWQMHDTFITNCLITVSRIWKFFKFNSGFNEDEIFK